MPRKTPPPPTGPRCSFCGRSVEDGVLVIPSENANICEDCARSVNAFIDEVHAKADALQGGGAEPSAARRKGAAKAARAPALGPVPPPREIKAFLDRYVIGHDATKKILSVAVHNHYRRLESATAKTDPEFADVEKIGRAHV